MPRLGQQTCHTPEEFKAWSQNLDHDSLMTTIARYGQVDTMRQAEIIRNLGQATPDPSHDAGLVQSIAKCWPSIGVAGALVWRTANEGVGKNPTDGAGRRRPASVEST
jgi:hypothetical protein